MLFNNGVRLTKEKIYNSLCLNADSLFLENLVKKGIVKLYESEVRNTGDASVKMIKALNNFDGKLTEKQKSAYEALLEFEACSVK